MVIRFVKQFGRANGHFRNNKTMKILMIYSRFVHYTQLLPLHGREIATLRKLKKPCVVMVAEKHLDNYNVEGLTCQLASQDLINGAKSQLVRVKGLTLAWARKNKVISGVTTLFAKNIQIDDKTDTLIFPRGVKVKVCFPSIRLSPLIVLVYWIQS
jgi:hypothetical protein